MTKLSPRRRAARQVRNQDMDRSGPVVVLRRRVAKDRISVEDAHMRYDRTPRSASASSG